MSKLTDIQKSFRQNMNIEQKQIRCPNCYKAYLQEAVNKLGDEVVQRVVSCDACAWVMSFDAPHNWRTRLDDDLNFLRFNVREGIISEEIAQEIIKRADWEEVDKLRFSGDFHADQVEEF